MQGPGSIFTEAEKNERRRKGKTREKGKGKKEIFLGLLSEMSATCLLSLDQRMGLFMWVLPSIYLWIGSLLLNKTCGWLHSLCWWQIKIIKFMSDKIKWGMIILWLYESSNRIFLSTFWYKQFITLVPHLHWYCDLWYI